MRLNIFSQEGLLFESVVDELCGMQRSKDAYSGGFLFFFKDCFSVDHSTLPHTRMELLECAENVLREMDLVFLKECILT